MKVVVFDWGGVLIEIVPSYARACEIAGVPVLEDLPFGFPYHADDAAGWRFERGEIGYEQFCAAASLHCEARYSPEDIGKIHAAILVREYDGAEPLVAELNGRVETALLSNTNAFHFETVKRSAGANLLKHKWASHLLGVAKPDPRIYRAFEEKLGARGADILFFDDRRENTEAASQSGWVTELVPKQDNPIPHIRERLRHHRIL